MSTNRFDCEFGLWIVRAEVGFGGKWLKVKRELFFGFLKWVWRGIANGHSRLVRFC
jgi:hypothetical protein